MYKAGEYITLFVVLVLVQVLLLNNLMLVPYVVPMIYVGFIALLPTNTPTSILILAGFGTGVVIDLMSGLAGLTTIALTATAFLRPVVMNITIGKDLLREHRTPDRGTLGTKEYLLYTSLLVLVHCTFFFFFEALTFKHALLTIVKIVASTIVSTLLIWITTDLFSRFSQTTFQRSNERTKR